MLTNEAENKNINIISQEGDIVGRYDENDHEWIRIR